MSSALLAAVLAACISVCRAQNIDVGPLPGIGGEHKHWYVWLIVSIAGATLIYVAFFALRGFLVARRRKAMFKAEGISEEDEVYGHKHIAIMQKLLPTAKLPQGKGPAINGDFSPLTSTAETWGDKTASGKLSPV